MMSYVSDFILGSLEDTDKHIIVADGHHVTDKQKSQVQIKMCDNNGDTFIAMLKNVILAPDLCKQVIFNYYVKEFGTYLFIAQRILYSVLQSKR